MKNFCHSCAAPLDMELFKGVSEKYCKYCSDENGNLKSREEAKMFIAGWFTKWQPGIDTAKAAERAENYMKAMPAWAEQKNS